MVHFHKFAENVGTEHHCFRNCDLAVFEFFKAVVAFDHGIDKGKSASFSAHRAFADARKVGILVESVPLENGNNSSVFNFAVMNDGIKNNLAHFVQIGGYLVVYIYVFKKFGQREHSPGI